MPKGGVQTNITYSWGNSSNENAWGPFSPGFPLMPVVQQPVRGYDFKPNINATLQPRAYEQTGFPALRAFANVELVRLAIETRKDQVERLDWQIKPVDGAAKIADDPRIAELTAFWRKPDGVTPFATFMRSSLEDLLTLDAPAFEKRRNRGGKLIALEIVPGDTVHPMVDDTGRRPRGVTDIAYQQVIKGVVWANLTNRDLLYVPRNVRPHHLYPNAHFNLYIVQNAAATPAWSTDGISGVQVTHLQLEQGARAPVTSIIPTNGAPVTREADLLVLPWARRGIPDGPITARFVFDDGSSQDRSMIVAGGVAAVPTDLARTRLRVVSTIG